MPEEVPVTQFTTKKLLIKEDNTDRFFEGILSAEIKDRQGEITDIDELYKALPVWMERNAPMSDTHSNRIVGRGINFERVTITSKNGEKVPAIKILGKIHSNTALDDFIWKQIVDGNYKGLSFGGATKANRVPVMQSDGSMAYALKDLEIYEVAVCEDPAVSFALITDVNPMAKTTDTVMHPSIEKAVHVEKQGEKIKIKCDGTECYVNAEVKKADLGTPIDQDDVPKKTETFIGEAGKSVYGQDEEDFKPTTKPLPTQWGAMEFDACESHAKKDPSIKNPGGYCGSIQQHVDKDTKVHAGQKEYGNTDSCIAGQGKKDEIKNPEAYCGSRHNDEHGMNPGDEKHKDTGAQAAGTGTGVGNQCDSKASCSEKPKLSEAGMDEVEKPSGDREYFKKSCGCKLSIPAGYWEHLEKDFHAIGEDNPRGLGAYNTSVNGTGGSNQVSRRVTDPARLGDPDKLENSPKKPKDPTVKSIDNNQDLYARVKDYIQNWCPDKINLQKNINKAYLDRDEPEWIADVSKFSSSAQGIAMYGENIEVDNTGNLIDSNGNIIFINPFIK